MRLTSLPALRRTGAAVATALAIVFAASAVLAGGLGAKYGARSPRTCSSYKASTLTATLARKFFICDNEFETKSGAIGDLLYLVSDVKIEVGVSRPYNALTDSFTSIDPKKPVYPIRGSYWSYQCGVAGSIGFPAGANCASADQTVAAGECYNDTFGDWHCSMLGNVMGSGMTRQQPPPARM